MTQTKQPPANPARFNAVTSAYDGFGRLISSTTTMGGVSRALTYQYDRDGDKTRITHPDTTAFGYDYDGLDRLSFLRDGSGNQLAMTTYYANGARGWRGQGANGTGYSWDAVMRLNSYGLQRLDPTTWTVSVVSTGFVYNPASQIVQQSRDSDAYTFTGYTSASTPYVANGLNQYTGVNGGTLTYDSNGNLASTGGTTFTYDVENRLVSATGTLNTLMVYDPLGRLYQTSGGVSGTTQFLYDGDALVAEYNGSGTLLRRYVHVDGDDHPLLWYEGSNTTPWRLYADHQGSIIQVIDDSGALKGIDSYDEYGVPGSSNYTSTLPQRFQYTGQAYLPDLGMYYYKARIYSSRLGRFLQTDPIGYKDQMDLYSYIGNDSANGRDPTGTQVQATFYEDSGLVIARDIDTGQIVSASAFSGGTSNGWYGAPIPVGNYAILAGKDSNHYRLERLDDHFGDDQTPEGRSQLRFHPHGTISVGCITCHPGLGGDAVGDLLAGTRTGVATVEYMGKNLFHSNTENVTQYGVMQVVADGPYRFDKRTNAVSIVTPARKNRKAKTRYLCTLGAHGACR